MSEKVRLRAEDIEDLAVIAALLQDARTVLREMVYDPEERRYLAAFTRYRREEAHDPETGEGLEECATALIFGCVDEVKHRGLHPEKAEEELALLTIATEPGTRHLFHIDLVFEGDREVQIRSDCIDCRLEDFGEAVPARRTPCDHFAELLRLQAQSTGKRAPEEAATAGPERDRDREA